MRVYTFYCAECQDGFEELLPRGVSPRSARCPMCRTASHRVPPAVRTGGASGEVATAFRGGCCGGAYGCGARSETTEPADQAAGAESARG